MTMRLQDHKDFIGGLLVLLLGLVTIQEAVSYKVGTLSRMGPGFFPLSLGVILCLTGLAIVVMRKRADSASVPTSPPPEWRGWLCICAGIASFVILGRYGGMMPATFATVFISAMGDRENSILTAAILAFVMCITCLIVFWGLLHMQLPLFQWG